MSVAEIATLLGSVANVGLLTGIFFRLGGFTQSIQHITWRLEQLEQK